MPHVIVESDASQPEGSPSDLLTFSVETIDLLALLSFGYAEPFGSQHQLTLFVRRLRQQHGIDITPLMTFYDRDVTDDEDRANLEAAWQPAAALSATLQATLAALSDDAKTAALLDGFDQLNILLPELSAMADWAAAREARIRLSFSMDPAPVDQANGSNDADGNPTQE